MFGPSFCWTRVPLHARDGDRLRVGLFDLGAGRSERPWRLHPCTVPRAACSPSESRPARRCTCRPHSVCHGETRGRSAHLSATLRPGPTRRRRVDARPANRVPSSRSDSAAWAQRPSSRSSGPAGRGRLSSGAGPCRPGSSSPRTIEVEIHPMAREMPGTRPKPENAVGASWDRLLKNGAKIPSEPKLLDVTADPAVPRRDILPEEFDPGPASGGTESTSIGGYLNNAVPGHFLGTGRDCPGVTQSAKPGGPLRTSVSARLVAGPRGEGLRRSVPPLSTHFGHMRRSAAQIGFFWENRICCRDREFGTAATRNRDRCINEIAKRRHSNIRYARQVPIASSRGGDP